MVELQRKHFCYHLGGGERATIQCRRSQSQHLQVKLGKSPAWRPGELLPVWVDSTDLNGPTIWLRAQSNGPYPQVHLSKCHTRCHEALPTLAVSYYCRSWGSDMAKMAMGTPKGALLARDWRICCLPAMWPFWAGQEGVLGWGGVEQGQNYWWLLPLVPNLTCRPYQVALLGGPHFYTG